MKNAHDMLHKRLEAFDRYVADLPTAEQNAEKMLEVCFNDELFFFSIKNVHPFSLTKNHVSRSNL